MATVNPTGIASTFAAGTPKLTVTAKGSGIASTFAAGTPKMVVKIGTTSSAPPEPTAGSFYTGQGATVDGSGNHIKSNTGSTV